MSYADGGAGADGGGFAWWRVIWVAGLGKAIWSLRLRLHSGLRQRGVSFFVL